MNIEEANSLAWDKEEKTGSAWSRMAGDAEIRKAREGVPGIRITTNKNIPPFWYEKLKGKKVLVLCGGGGQQTPLLSAYGADVTTVDISPMQIEADRKALEYYSLKAETIVGSVLSLPFEDDSFDAVLNPVSLNFVDDLKKAYTEITRVLKKGGYFMMGIANPILYIFDEKKQERKLVVKYTLPFSSTRSLSKKELEKREKKHDTLEFSHTLDDILGSLLRKGFTLLDFFSDSALSEPTDSFVHDSFLAFLFQKNGVSAVLAHSPDARDI